MSELVEGRPTSNSLREFLVNTDGEHERGAIEGLVWASESLLAQSQICSRGGYDAIGSVLLEAAEHIADEASRRKAAL